MDILTFINLIFFLTFINEIPEERILEHLPSFVCLFDLILYVPSTIFQLNRDGSSWVEPVLS